MCCSLVLERTVDLAETPLEFGVIEFTELVAQLEFLLVELDRLVVGTETFAGALRSFGVLRSRSLLERG